MSTRRLFQVIGLALTGLLADATQGPSGLSRSASAQGFHFESWHGGFGRPAGVSIGIGVPPSSPLIYGVRPSHIFPPLGFHGDYAPGSPAVPYGLYGYRDFGYRDYRADYYNRLYQQYRAQLDATDHYRVDPLYQSHLNRYLGGLSVPPLDAAPPVVAIEPFEQHGYAAAPPDSVQVATEDLARLLSDAAARLSRALARRGEQGEIWRDYLAPDRIIEAIEQRSDPRQLGTLLLNYDGVLANSQLRWVMRSDGFAQTRELLREYIQRSGAAQPDQADEPAADEPVQQDSPQRDPAQREPAERDPEVPPPPPSPSPAGEQPPPTGPAQPDAAEGLSPSGGIAL